MCFHIIVLGDLMSNLTLAVTDELKRKMDKHTEIRWSNVARDAFEEKIQKLELMDSLLEKSNFSEEDAEKIGHKIKSEIRKRFDKRFA